MLSYKLTVAYDGLDVEDFDQLEAIAEYLPDVVVGVIDGNARIHAVLEAASAIKAADALADAMAKAVPDAIPLRAEFEQMNVSDIAAQVSVNREAVRLWVAGKRGPGNFPTPLSIIGDRTRIWAASDVHEWLSSNGFPVPKSKPLSMDEVTDVNRTLHCRRELMTGSKTVSAIWQVVGRAGRSGLAVTSRGDGGVGAHAVDVSVVKNVDLLFRYSVSQFGNLDAAVASSRRTALR